MCALFGWIDYKGLIPHRSLKKLTQALANAAEERGTDASGISYVNNGKVTIFKRPKPAHKVRFNIPENTRVVMGHTRLTTQGNEKFNINNHPFYGSANVDFAFAHNGVLYNDKELRLEYNLPETQIETDSYIAVQLIEKQGKLNFESLKFMAETVQGNFTFTALDENNSLYIVKGSNPICLLHFEELGLYVYASTETIMYQALYKMGMQKISHNKIKITEGDIIKIECNGNIFEDKFEARYFSRGLSYYDWYDDYYYDGYTEHEQLLLDMCGYYGVDEDDIIMLLEYGYTTDEIEDMLIDIDLIRETISAVKGEEEYYKSVLSI